jgi:hypothetical protein
VRWLYPGCHNICSFSATDLNLGIVRATKLRLSVYPDHESVPVIFGLLRQTLFPELLHLALKLHTERLTHLRSPDGTVVFDPLHTSKDGHPAQDWTLPLSIAAKLDTVDIALPRIEALKHADHFFELFGQANRPEVLRVVTNGVRFMD